VRSFAAAHEGFAVRALKLFGRLGSWAETEDSDDKLSLLWSLSWADLIAQVIKAHPASVEVQREGVYAMGMWAWSDLTPNAQILTKLFCSVGAVEMAVVAIPCRGSWRLSQTLHFFSQR